MNRRAYFLLILLFPLLSFGQDKKPVWTAAEQPIVDQLHGLRALPDDVRAKTTKDLALQIRALPVVPNKLSLANHLADLSTEGDFGRGTLQEVTTTLAEALREQPAPPTKDGPAEPYVEVAQLVKYEQMQASAIAENPQFTAALAKLESDDQKRQDANFTLTDLTGKSWTLKDLHGKVVVVNFWATWCPPCRKEMPDLDALYQQFKDQGLVILAISDEELAKVQLFIEQRKISYPVMLDPGRKVNDLFEVQGIPKSFVYNREGKLVAQSIDMRTRGQFLAMLAQAGLK